MASSFASPHVVPSWRWPPVVPVTRLRFSPSRRNLNAMGTYLYFTFLKLSQFGVTYIFILLSGLEMLQKASCISCGLLPLRRVNKQMPRGRAFTSAFGRFFGQVNYSLFYLNQNNLKVKVFLSRSLVVNVLRVKCIAQVYLDTLLPSLFDALYFISVWQQGGSWRSWKAHIRLPGNVESRHQGNNPWWQ